ncbi:MAG: LuxR C-terminal-related transcriptional regulator [Cyclobacteriaceae bacterium]
MSASNTILQTKLHRPPVTYDVLVRSRIVDLLEQNIDKPLSLIAAPAGYGKSMAASIWLEQTQTKYTWISIDEEQNDLRTFLLYLNAAIKKLYPSSMNEIEAILMAPELPPIKIISYAVINDLDRIKESFILVLDDYHLIHDTKVHQLINEIIQYPPECIHISLLTRIDPPLKLTPLLAKGRMIELRMTDLCFTEQEITDLYQQLLREELNHNIAKAFHDKTEGWIVGLRMALLNVEKSDDVERIIAHLNDIQYPIDQYLIEEVMLKQPENIRKLLLDTSLLDRFCADLIEIIEYDKDDNALTGEAFMKWLVSSNLFIISLDDEREWNRYHHLIQRLLRFQLKKHRSKNEISTLNHRFSRWFEEHGFIQESIKHMIAAKHLDEACSIIERHRMDRLDDDRWYEVQKWLEVVPVEKKLRSPGLLLSEGWSAYENFQLDKLSGLLDRVKVLFGEQEKDKALLGEYYLIYGLVTYWNGNGEAAIENLQKALELLPNKRKLAMGMLHLHIALARGTIGKAELAIKDLRRLLEKEPGSAIYNTRLMSGLFYVYQFKGELSESRIEAQRVQYASKANNLMYTEAMGVCMEGCSCFNSFKLKDALRLFTIALDQRYILHRGVALDAIAGLAITHQLLHQSSEADRVLEILEDFERENNFGGNLLITNSCRTRLAILRGDIIQLPDWENVEIPEPSYAGFFIWLEIPMITQIKALIAQGTSESMKKAEDLIERVLKVSNKYHLIIQTIDILILKSCFLRKQGMKEDAKQVLIDVIELAEKGDCIRPFIEAGAEIFDLISDLRKTDGHQLFIDRLLIKIEHYLKNNSQYVSKELNVITPSKEKLNPIDSISVRERDVIKLLRKGFRNKEIAGQLFVSEGTVKKHIYNVFQKLGVNSRIELLNFLRNVGFYENEDENED